MIDTLAALLLAVSAPPQTPPPLTPPPATAAPVTVTAPAPEPELSAEEMAKTVAQMQDMYEQSCASREYGAYDDVCDVLNTQLKDAKAHAAQLAKKAKAAARRRNGTPP